MNNTHIPNKTSAYLLLIVIMALTVGCLFGRSKNEVQYPIVDDLEPYVISLDDLPENWIQDHVWSEMPDWKYGSKRIFIEYIHALTRGRIESYIFQYTTAEGAEYGYPYIIKDIRTQNKYLIEYFEYKSSYADESQLFCVEMPSGWPRCEYFARYRNNVFYMYLNAYLSTEEMGELLHKADLKMRALLSVK